MWVESINSPILKHLSFRNAFVLELASSADFLIKSIILSQGINGARGCYYDNEKIEAMRDYFDWFLVAVSDYQNKLKCGDTDFTKFETYLNENPEYDPSFLEIKDWEEWFFLQPYFEKGKPVWLFETPSERRTLITAAPENRRGKKYYQDEEYLKLMEDYLDKSKAVIEFRTEKMIDCLQRKLME